MSGEAVASGRSVSETAALGNAGEGGEVVTASSKRTPSPWEDPPRPHVIVFRDDLRFVLDEVYEQHRDCQDAECPWHRLRRAAEETT